MRPIPKCSRCGKPMGVVLRFNLNGEGLCPDCLNEITPMDDQAKMMLDLFGTKTGIMTGGGYEQMMEEKIKQYGSIEKYYEYCNEKHRKGEFLCDEEEDEPEIKQEWW